MSTQVAGSEYLLLFRGTNWDKGLSPEEMQQVMGQFMGWFEQLRQSGTLKGGQPLAREGKIVSGVKGSAVADGPFAESKEAVGGYFLVQAANLDAAVAIAKECPILKFGSTVEVRPIAAQCPIQETIDTQLAGSVGTNA